MTWPWLTVPVLVGIFLYACLQVWVGINEYLTGDWYEWRWWRR